MLKNNIEISLQTEKGLREKTNQLGEGIITEAPQTNIIGVTENASFYKSSSELLKQYKEQLDIDLDRIRDIGIKFFEIDSNLFEQSESGI